ncbi:hypothetical protein MSPP1_001682 [Malassezia sp. CBS 17886]|nr:hypothetical protein MSPP1_001682 [Malassezia sp. CBS 17886]
MGQVADAGTQRGEWPFADHASEMPTGDAPPSPLRTHAGVTDVGRDPLGGVALAAYRPVLQRQSISIQPTSREEREHDAFLHHVFLRGRLARASAPDDALLPAARRSSVDASKTHALSADTHAHVPRRPSALCEAWQETLAAAPPGGRTVKLTPPGAGPERRAAGRHSEQAAMGDLSPTQRMRHEWPPTPGEPSIRIPRHSEPQSVLELHAAQARRADSARQAESLWAPPSPSPATSEPPLPPPHAAHSPPVISPSAHSPPLTTRRSSDHTMWTEQTRAAAPPHASQGSPRAVSGAQRTRSIGSLSHRLHLARSASTLSVPRGCGRPPPSPLSANAADAFARLSLDVGGKDMGSAEPDGASGAPAADAYPGVGADASAGPEAYAAWHDCPPEGVAASDPTAAYIPLMPAYGSTHSEAYWPAMDMSMMYPVPPASVPALPACARSFVIKSFTDVDVQKSLEHGVWTSTEKGNRRLDQAWAHSHASGPIYLFFSVNGSGRFCGVAQMTSGLDYSRTTDIWADGHRWKGLFRVRWLLVKDVPNPLLRHILLTNVPEIKPVTQSRDTQELLPETSAELLRIFCSYSGYANLPMA